MKLIKTARRGSRGPIYCQFLSSTFLTSLLVLQWMQEPVCLGRSLGNGNTAAGRQQGLRLPPGTVPLPASYQRISHKTNWNNSDKITDDEYLLLSEGIPFSFQLAAGSAINDILLRALERFANLLEVPEGTKERMIARTRRTSIASVQSGNSHDGLSNATRTATRTATSPSHQTLKACHVFIASASTDLHQDTNESYTLLVDNQPQLRNQKKPDMGPLCLITAPSVFGAMYGMETFVQLVTHTYHRSVILKGAKEQKHSDTLIPNTRRTVPSDIFLADRPRFSVRSTMIDTARHWLPVNEVILPHIDAMAAAKMNLLHWHMVDSQSWPYDSQAFPELAAHGAYYPHQVYTAADIKRVVTYAKDRGVNVIPEFDTPGHVWAGLTALDPPVLTECYDAGGNILGFGPVNPAKETTFNFLAKLLSEVIPLFGSGMFMIGGDEVDYTCWASNPDVVQFVKAQGWGSDMSKLHDYYTQRILKLLAEQNASTIMVWEEVFHSHKGNGLPQNSTMVNVWRAGWEWCSRETSSNTVDRSNASCASNYGNGGPWFGKKHVRDFSWTSAMAKAAVAGYKTVLSSPFYLNVHNAGSNFDEAWPYVYAIEPTAFEAKRQPQHVRSDQEKTIDDVENEGTFLTAAEREGSVLGVQACLWTEWTNHANFLPRYWPIVAAVAERGWSTKDTTSIDDFRRRLFRFACELQRRGIPAEPAVFGGGFFYPNGTVCYPGGGAIGPTRWETNDDEDGCLPRFSSCASLV